MKLRRTEERIIFVLRSLFLAVSTFVVYLLPRSCSTFAFSALFRDSGVWHWRVYTIQVSYRLMSANFPSWETQFSGQFPEM